MTGLAQPKVGETLPLWTEGYLDILHIMPETKKVIGSRIDNMKSQQGQRVVRVSPRGESYMIYILDDSQESFTIKSIHGPYPCD
jgi:hypothetical protein